ncbi:hypothetical protein BH11PSE11_BH11PSE11_13530 [soil metagenome]
MEFSKKDREIVRLWNLQRHDEEFCHEGDDVTIVAHEIESGCAAQFTPGKTRYKFCLSNGKNIVIVASWPCDALASDSSQLFEDDELEIQAGLRQEDSAIGAVGMAASRMHVATGYGHP